MIPKETIELFATIDLHNAHVSIPDRSDQKVVIHIKALSSLLKMLAAEYDLLAFDNNTLLEYETTYYDTPNLQFYLEHHNGVFPRTKIRKRNYLNSSDQFLELKRKTNRAITYKIREQIETSLTPFEFSNFVSQHLSVNPDHLTPTLQNRFHRLFLVKKDKTMRMTIDTNIKVKTQGTNYQPLYPKLAVIELKANKNQANSTKQFFKTFGAVPTRFSKYCLGIIKLYPETKHNTFNKTLHLLDKISEQ